MSVAILLESTDKKVILQKRDDKPGINHPGKVTLFAGGVEEGEEPLAAALRELKEELTLDLWPEDLTFLCEFTRTHPNGARGVVYVFIARNIDPKLLSLQEGEAIVYLSKTDDLSQYNLGQKTREIIQEFWSSES